MNATITSFWALPELDLEVVNLLEAEYGSSDLDALDQLAANLDRRLDDTDASRILLDVSAVRYAGAGWLGVLAAFAARCRRLGRKLLICGDRNGLLKWARLDKSAQLFRDFPSAIASCPRPAYLGPRRVSLPLPLLDPTPRMALQASAR